MNAELAKFESAGVLKGAYDEIGDSKKGNRYASVFPIRFACIIPVCNENPKLLSTLLPFSIAHREPLPPRWQDISFPVPPSRSVINSAI